MRGFYLIGILLLAACTPQERPLPPRLLTEVTPGTSYMQFPDYAQIRYPDGRYCVFAPYEKIWNTEPIERVWISAKFRNGVIPIS